MKIFVSSLISGMEANRAAVRRSITALGHQPVMAEDFGAKPTSPQIACLQGVRDADLVVLIFGERYGAVQASGLSATHEEFKEAAGRKPILTFAQNGMHAEANQDAFMKEAGGWEGGLFRAPFGSPEELGDAVAGAIHRHELAHATAPLDPADMRARAVAGLPEVSHASSASGVVLSLSIAPGPDQAILRPAELETPKLAEALQKEGMFGQHRVFDIALGFSGGVKAGALTVQQAGRHSSFKSRVSLRENGELLIQLAVDPPSHQGIPAIIEEHVEARLRAALSFGAWVLDRIDPTQRLTHAALAVRLDGGSYCCWRTQAEHDASPRSVPMNGFGTDNAGQEPITLTPAHRARAALTMDAGRLVEDLVTLLRRRWKEHG